MSFDLVIPGNVDFVARHFSLHEFACSCCKTVRINPGFFRIVDYLEALRSRIGGVPITITSGHRCYYHNQRTKGASPDSRHMYGDGVDFAVAGFSPTRLADVLEELDFPGVIIGYPTHLHIDLRPVIPTPRRWVEGA